MLKNITLSAEEILIQQAREKAAKQRKSLNQYFREWLQQFVNPKSSAEDFRKLMKRLSYAKPGRKFTREEMNERR